MRTPSTALERVITLLNAISDLREGDLLAVLELDRYTPLIDLGDNDTFQLGEDGKIIHTPGFPPPRSLMHRAATGADLARILEQHLEWVMAFGQAHLPVYQKRRRKKELGGTMWLLRN